MSGEVERSEVAASNAGLSEADLAQRSELEDLRELRRRGFLTGEEFARALTSIVPAPRGEPFYGPTESHAGTWRRRSLAAAGGLVLLTALGTGLALTTEGGSPTGLEQEAAPAGGPPQVDSSDSRTVEPTRPPSSPKPEPTRRTPSPPAPPPDTDGGPASSLPESPGSDNDEAQEEVRAEAEDAEPSATDVGALVAPRFESEVAATAEDARRLEDFLVAHDGETVYLDVTTPHRGEDHFFNNDFLALPRVTVECADCRKEYHFFATGPETLTAVSRTGESVQVRGHFRVDEAWEGNNRIILTGVHPDGLN
jgi:hypothetical protein